MPPPPARNDHPRFFSPADAHNQQNLSPRNDPVLPCPPPPLLPLSPPPPAPRPAPRLTDPSCFCNSRRNPIQWVAIITAQNHRQRHFIMQDCAGRDRGSSAGPSSQGSPCGPPAPPHFSDFPVNLVLTLYFSFSKNFEGGRISIIFRPIRANERWAAIEQDRGYPIEATRFDGLPAGGRLAEPSRTRPGRPGNNR